MHIETLEVKDLKNRFWSAIICILLICFLAACNDNFIDHSHPNETPSISTSIATPETSVPETDPPSTTSSTIDTSTDTPQESEDNTIGMTTIPETSTPPQTSQVPETKPPETTTTPETQPPVTTPTTEPPKTEPPATEPEDTQPILVPATAVNIHLVSYVSGNEPKPYVKDSAIYSILYKGERVQVGDLLVYEIDVSPANHTDNIAIGVTDNLSYELSGNTLTVKVNSISDLGSGRITVYVQDPTNGAIRANTRTTFAVDASGNPFDNLTTIFSAYIRALGMSYTTVSQGYTYSDPTLSFTSFAGAPAWDDQILKSESTWLARCFWLLDEYKEAGFSKVNFIETNTEFGFSASK